MTISINVHNGAAVYTINYVFEHVILKFVSVLFVNEIENYTAV